jgi:hypothetical protein
MADWRLSAFTSTRGKANSPKHLFKARPRIAPRERHTLRGTQLRRRKPQRYTHRVAISNAVADAHAGDRTIELGAPCARAVPPDLRSALTDERIERFIGVIYRPDTEHWSHYSSAVLAEQYDGWVWFDHTEAVAAIAGEAEGPDADTFPFRLFTRAHHETDRDKILTLNH